MPKPRLTLNHKGVRSLLVDPRVRADLQRRANAIAAAAGPGHRIESGGHRRARSAVITDTFEARHAEATDRNLTRSIDAGRR